MAGRWRRRDMARLLILGGTAEAAELSARLAGDDRLETVTSLAGLTRMPAAMGGRVRRGGFGGPDGLAAFLKDERYDALIDATHPFAARIAAHAAEAAEIAGVPRVKLVRPPFQRTEGDRFVPVPDMQAAAAALPQGARVFLAAGRREIAAFAARPDLWCLVRMIEPPAAGERLRMLDEACQVMIALWTLERASFEGAHYQLREAYHEPKPIQRPHPPLVIGGSGEKVTLRIVAKYANEWNFNGRTANAEEFVRKSRILDDHCAAVGRDPSEIGRSVQFGAGPSAAESVELGRRFAEAGATHLIYSCPQPFSAEGARWLWDEVVGPLKA